ncbi:MAG: flagellar motor protein MotA, partial [Rhodoblastus sp.]
MSDKDAYRLSSPAIFLLRMAVFLILVGFVAVILHGPIETAFLANPALNGVIIGAAAIGVLIAFGQVMRLFREIAWVNNGRSSRKPRLLAPMARIVGPEGRAPLSPQILRLVLDSVATRLDEGRETSRYLTGLLVF